MKKQKLERSKHINQDQEKLIELQKYDNKQDQLAKYNPENIEYISIITQDFDTPVYYIAISNSKGLEIISDSCTTSKEAIVSLLEQIKQSFLSIAGYVSVGEGKPLINIHRATLVSLIHDEIDGKKQNYARIMLSNGQTCDTQPEVSDSHKLNTAEYLYYTYWSRKNESSFGKGEM